MIEYDNEQAWIWGDAYDEWFYEEEHRLSKIEAGKNFEYNQKRAERLRYEAWRRELVLKIKTREPVLIREALKEFRHGKPRQGRAFIVTSPDCTLDGRHYYRDQIVEFGPEIGVMAEANRHFRALEDDYPSLEELRFLQEQQAKERRIKTETRQLAYGMATGRSRENK